MSYSCSRKEIQALPCHNNGQYWPKLHPNTLGSSAFSPLKVPSTATCKCWECNHTLWFGKDMQMCTTCHWEWQSLLQRTLSWKLGSETAVESLPIIAYIFCTDAALIQQSWIHGFVWNREIKEKKSQILPVNAAARSISTHPPPQGDLEEQVSSTPTCCKSIPTNRHWKP